jgi:hypothetical protein
MKLESDGKKTNWLSLVAILVGVAYGYHGSAGHRTAKDLVHEASGQEAVPADASIKEKQIVDILAQMLALRKENDRLDQAFGKTFTGAHLLQPETLSSPKIVAQSLSEIENYCSSVSSLTQQTHLLIIRTRQMDNLPQELSWIEDEYNAANELCSATTKLYQYAADPAQEVSVRNGVVSIVGVTGYNELVEKANETHKKLEAAMVVFRENQKKLRQQTNTTASDYGLKEDK